MKNLRSLKKYFIRHKWRLLLGILFVSISNLFAVIPPTLVRTVIDQCSEEISSYRLLNGGTLAFSFQTYLFGQVFWYGLLLIALALLRGLFLFLMRQTIIVMSRHIEYDQKKELYQHYQTLDTSFFKKHNTGDLMNRLSEDVSRVRMFTGPTIMYSVNLIVLTSMCLWGMLRVNPILTLCILVPLPFLAIAIYSINKIIFKKSNKIQEMLSTITHTAQETFSGIRVFKSYVQEKTQMRFFKEYSEQYKKSNIQLALTEAIYLPSMNFFIGLSMISTVLIGGYFTIQGKASAGNIAEFVLYINLMMFPMFILGWIASMIQRASASQKRIQDFLNTKPRIKEIQNPKTQISEPSIEFQNLSFTFEHSNIQALKAFSLKIESGKKVLILGKTGSGKSTLAQLLLRMYDPQQGAIFIGSTPIKQLSLKTLRDAMSYTPQEGLLFSDTIENNIKFGNEKATAAQVQEVARLADLEHEIEKFPQAYETLIGERGVLLSGGQKQRLVLARALLKNSPILLLDECLSAVDNRTEKTIFKNLETYLKHKTLLIISHRIVKEWHFDTIIYLVDGQIVEQGSHDELMKLEGAYFKLYQYQTNQDLEEDGAIS